MLLMYVTTLVGKTKIANVDHEIPRISKKELTCSGTGLDFADLSQLNMYEKTAF